MKIQKKISNKLLYLTTISNLIFLNPIISNATIIRNSSRSVRNLISLFNKGVTTSSNITKTPLEDNLNNVNAQPFINKFNPPNFTPATTKISLKNPFENINAKSSILSLTSINSNTSTDSSTETFPNINIGSIISRFEASIKTSNKTTFPQKNTQTSTKKYSTSGILKLSNEVLDKNGFLDGFNKINKSLPKLESPLLGRNLDDNLKILQERKYYLNSFLVGSMTSKGIIFEKDTTPKQQQKNPYSNISPFMKSLLISRGIIPEKNNNQQ